MSYRTRPDGYDALKWGMAPRKRERRAATKWMIGLSLALVLIDLVLVTAAGKDGQMPMPTILLPAILGAGMSPFARASWLTRAGRARYDEFERAAYARATAIAYVVFLAFVSALFVYLTLAARAGLPIPQGKDWLRCGVAVLVIGAMLPLLLAEITVPLPPAPGEWDE